MRPRYPSDSRLIAGTVPLRWGSDKCFPYRQKERFSRWSRRARRTLFQPKVDPHQVNESGRRERLATIQTGCAASAFRWGPITILELPMAITVRIGNLGETPNRCAG